MSDALDRLLDRLSKGEMDAAGEVYQAFEPVLRVMVRRQLSAPMRAKFDSMDVVHSAWADMLKAFRAEGWRFSDREHLRAYLARVTYNHFVNHCRRHSLVMQYEQQLAADDERALPASAQPRPSELAQADELWERLMVLCSPAHRNLLHLRRQGFTLGEIAKKTGLHESSVRRILYELARRLAAVRGQLSSATIIANGP
jgi:RNA polymerase sigma factor (sigma-70 family)